MEYRIHLPVDLKHREYDLSGSAGNAYAIMGFVARVFKEFRQADIISGKECDRLIDEYTKKARAGNYENLLKVTKEYVNITFVGLDEEDDE